MSGIDAARGIALLGMLATHLLALYGAGASWPPTWVGLHVSGRAAALFAVLAGVGLALATGRQVPLTGPRLNAARRSTAARAAVLLAIGLSLGMLKLAVAVVLVPYAVLFLCMLPFLGLRMRTLGMLAVGWTVLSPLAAYILRGFTAGLPGPRALAAPASWSTAIGNPWLVLQDTVLTGYFPVLQWMSYLLVGLLLGRLALHRARVQFGLLAGGVLVAFTAKGVAGFLLDTLGGEQALLATPSGASVPLHSVLKVDLSGVQQSGSLWWLATAAPHSGTTLDLVGTAAVAAAVVGACLLANRVHPRLLLPLSGAGAMTLTLYAAHLAVLSGHMSLPGRDRVSGPEMFAAQVFAALVVGTFLAVLGRRGPLEWITHCAAAVAGWQRSTAPAARATAPTFRQGVSRSGRV